VQPDVKRLLAGLLLLGASACTRTEPALEVREIRSPAGAASAQPELTVGGDGRVCLSWLERTARGGHALRYAEWTGTSWSAPRRVAEGENWFANWADFPSVTALDDGSLLAHWLQKTGDEPYAYAVMLSRSMDGGTSWSAPSSPHDASPTEHGFVSTVPLPGGRAAIVWLDGRETGAHEGGPGAMTLRSTVMDADGAFQADDVLDARVCDCCQTSATAVPDGGLLVAYRDRSEAEVRDISLVRSEGEAWSQPQPVSGDRWTIPGCPVNGPAVAARGDAVALAWFTGTGGQGHVRLVHSSDRGRTFGAPVEVDLGEPLGRTDVVFLEDGTPLVSWIEVQEDGARILVRRVPADRPPGPPVTIGSTSKERAAGFPRMAPAGSTILIAWPDPGEDRVRTAAIRVRGGRAPAVQ
jgi:hypothetical protein